MLQKGEEHSLDGNSSPLSLELFQRFHEYSREGDIVGVARWRTTNTSVVDKLHIYEREAA